MAEGARLESEFGLTPNVGSNPTLSALRTEVRTSPNPPKLLPGFPLAWTNPSKPLVNHYKYLEALMTPRLSLGITQYHSSWLPNGFRMASVNQIKDSMVMEAKMSFLVRMQNKYY